MASRAGNSKITVDLRSQPVRAAFLFSLAARCVPRVTQLRRHVPALGASDGEMHRGPARPARKTRTRSRPSWRCLSSSVPLLNSFAPVNPERSEASFERRRTREKEREIEGYHRGRFRGALRGGGMIYFDPESGSGARAGSDRLESRTANP